MVLAWLRDVLEILKSHNIGWALWNFRGPFGILDSEDARALLDAQTRPDCGGLAGLPTSMRRELEQLAAAPRQPGRPRSPVRTPADAPDGG